ncbi:DUF1684 domain-containing protein [Streptomyces sp. NPDC002788]
MVLIAAETDGLSAGGQPFTGEVRLGADPGPAGGARVQYGERRPVVLVREGVWGVQGYAPEASTRRPFAVCASRRTTRAGRCRGASCRTVRAAAPFGCRTPTGGSGGLELGGEPAIEPDGQELNLQVTVQQERLSVDRVRLRRQRDGGYRFRFRFLRPGAPEAEGRKAVDFNRAMLPPCAVAGHFVCLCPPTGEHARWSPLPRGRGRCCDWRAVWGRS